MAVAVLIALNIIVGALCLMSLIELFKTKKRK